MFHSLNGSAHCAHRQTNLPLRFGNRLLLGGITTLGFQCNTTMRPTSHCSAAKIPRPTTRRRWLYRIPASLWDWTFTP